MTFYFCPLPMATGDSKNKLSHVQGRRAYDSLLSEVYYNGDSETHISSHKNAYTSIVREKKYFCLFNTVPTLFQNRSRAVIFTKRLKRSV